jgi:hypothetical protein
MRQVNLLEHRLTLAEGENAHAEKEEANQTRLGQGPSIKTENGGDYIVSNCRPQRETAAKRRKNTAPGRKPWVRRKKSEGPEGATATIARSTIEPAT